MYFWGMGVVQDYAEGEKWARLAAEQGDASGQVLLGIMYDEGFGFPHDSMLAHMWLNLGIAGLPAGARRDAAVELRDAAAKELTSAQLARAQEWHATGAPPPPQDQTGGHRRMATLEGARRHTRAPSGQ
jgi:uncharacterized protein